MTRETFELTARHRLGGLVILGLVLALVQGLGAGGAVAKGPCPERHTGGATRDGLDGGRGADCLDGGAGRDVLAGGAGGDRLIGGGGDDQLLPGGGRDRIAAGPGDDLIFARDGRAEPVDCGPGDDLVSADADDVLRGCEEVRLAAPEVSWLRFYMHANAYGYGAVGYREYGSCSGDASAATCRGKSEEGHYPFSAGQEIRMEWEPSAYGGAEIVTLRAPGTDSVLIGRADSRWSGPGLQITAGWVGQWIDPNHGVIRTGVGGAPGDQGGPLKANLSYHSFPNIPFVPPRASGYSLDLRGWLKFVFLY